MEEDILFGKRRHLFGGIAPSNMLSFTGKINGADSTITLTTKLPLDTILDDQMICCVGGAVIRKSYNDYPKDEFDGEFVADIKADGTITVPESEKRMVYFTAFPYSKQGVYNRNKVNRLEVNMSREYLFGYDLDMTDPDPDTRVTYPSDVDNANFAPAYMNFSANTFDYGDWPSTPGSYFIPKPCMLKFDGTVDYYLNPDDYTKKDDGVTASDVTNTSYEGNAMVEWPKIYTKRWEENGIYHFRCSDVKVDDTWDCWCNYDKNNNEIPYFYTAIYNGVMKSSKMRSLSYSNTEPTFGYTLSQQMTYSKNNGEHWHMDVIADRLLVQDLLVMMGRSTDASVVYGPGACYTGAVYRTVGLMNNKGMFWGAKAQNGNGVKVFGMEHYWGNAFRRVAGWMWINGKNAYKITRGTHDGSTATDYNTTGSGYITADDVSAVSTTQSGSVKLMHTTPFGRFPYKTGGSDSTYEADALVTNYSTSEKYCALVGGYFTSKLGAGPFTVYMNKTISETGGICTSISCKPPSTT